MDQEVSKYLDRIQVQASQSVDLPSLAEPQLKHLEHVPFENLDVFHGRGVTVDQTTSVEKVLSGRGGWCFELNGAFAWLLSQLGFVVEMIACTVLIGDDPPDVPDHLALVVHMEGKRYLVDVGFGDSFVQPLDIESRDPAEGLNAGYRLSGESRLVLEHQTGRDTEWDQLYLLDLLPRHLDEFTPRSDYLQTEPGLKWTAAPFATRLLRNGRVTLLKDRLKMTTPVGVTEFPVTNEEWPVLLSQWFSIEDSLERH